MKGFRSLLALAANAQVRLAATVLAVVLALQDLIVRQSARNLPVGPPLPVTDVPAVDQLSSGAPFHTFSAVSSDYFTFRIHWLILPLALLSTLALHAWLRRLRTLPRLAAGLIPALLFVLMLEYAVVEAVPRPLRFAAHPTRVWTLRADPADEKKGDIPTEGFRATPPGASDGPIILIVGDSTTYGTGLQHAASTYCWKLAVILSQMLPSAPRVMNRGVPGYTSWQGKLLLRELLSGYRPRVVVVGLMANDWTWARQPDASLELEGLAGRLRARLRTSPLYLSLERLAFARHREIRERGILASESGGARVSITEFEGNLETMRQMCVQAEVPVVFLCLPMAPAMEARSQPYREAVARVASRPGAGWINVYGEWKSRGWNRRFFLPQDPIHPIEQGHEEIAKRLADRILPLLQRR